MARKTVVAVLGSGILAVVAGVAGPAIGAGGKKAHTSGAGTTSSEHAPGKFQVSAKAEEEGVLGGAKGHVRFTGHIDIPGDPIISVPADFKLDVVCMTNTTHEFEGHVIAKVSVMGARNPATGLYYVATARDDVHEGHPLTPHPDQFHISGPHDLALVRLVCEVGGGPSASGHFEVTRGNVVVKDATR